MITLAANQCSFWHSTLTSLVGGEVGSLGFFVNMFLVSGAIYLYKMHKNKPVMSDAAKKVAADIMNG